MAHGARPAALVLLGDTPPLVAGDPPAYVAWYERVWGGALHLVHGRGDGRLPDPRGFAGLILSGSYRSLAAIEPWMETAAELVRRAYDAGTPVLGVCFGHQLIGHAFGARVIVNQRGWELGTHELRLNAAGRADPLFAGLGAALRVNFAHRDIIDHTSLPPDERLRVLASNDMAEVQALAVGEHVRGIQFHPEQDAAILSANATKVGVAPTGPIEDCADGVAVVANFRRLFVER
jgi:GMP synthase (glutamine-hydrolysing)